MRPSVRKTRLESFIENAKLVHSKEDLDYSKAKYINNRTKLLVIDHDRRADGTEYGEYWVTPANHLKGEGHPQKMQKKQPLSKGTRTERIIEKFKEIYHNRDFDYSEVKYHNLNTPVCIIDRSLDENGREKGEFWVTPKEFLKGNILDDGKKIKYEPPMAEEEIITALLKSLPDLKITQNDHSVLAKKEIDIYLPEQKFGVEYNGLQWHTEWASGRKSGYHIGKTGEASSKGVSLVHIFESDFVKKPQRIIDSIIHKANLDKNKEKIYARCCHVKELSHKKAKRWAEETGFETNEANLHFGLVRGHEIIAILSLQCNKGVGWIISDYMSNPKYIVSGTFSKLFCHFVRKYHPKSVKVSVPIEYSPNKESNVFVKNGFVFIEQTLPDFGYFKRSDGPVIQRKDAVIHRLRTRKGNLSSKSETQLAKQFGYDRIWNCGKYVYLWKKE